MMGWRWRVDAMELNPEQIESLQVLLLAMLPVALTSFGYHHSVASLRAYYQNEQQARWAILGGTLIALALYVLWLLGIFDRGATC